MTKPKGPTKSPRTAAHGYSYCATARKRMRVKIEKYTLELENLKQQVERIKLVIGHLTSQKELDMLETLTSSEREGQKKLLDW